MGVSVEGNGNRTAGGDYVEDRSTRVNIGRVSIALGEPAASAQGPAEPARSLPELRAQYAHLCAVHRALRRGFVGHRTVMVFATLSALMLAVMLAAWGEPPGAPASLLFVALAVGGVLPSALWMVHARKAHYAELRSSKKALFAVECELLRSKAEAEVQRGAGQ